MLQVITYNLGGAKHLRADHFDYYAVAADAVTTIRRALDPAAPTIIALQEVGWGIGDRWYDCALHIAQLLGEDYRYAFGAEISREQHPHADFWGRPLFAGLKGAAEGNAIVTNLSPAPWPWPTVESHGPKVDWATNVSIGRPTLYSTATRDTQPRCALVASLQLDDLPLFFINTHLTTLRGESRLNTDDARAGQASALRSAEVGGLSALTGELIEAEYAANRSPIRPVLLAGDFNARPNTPEMRLLNSRFRWIQPETEPFECWSHIGHHILIDHIYVNALDTRLKTRRCVVVTDLPYNDLSDHRPVLAVFDVQPEEE